MSDGRYTQRQYEDLGGDAVDDVTEDTRSETIAEKSVDDGRAVVEAE